MRQRNFKKYFKFYNFSEIFYYGMTRLRNTDLSVFMQCQYTRTILTNENMGQSLFKKHSKFQNFDEILYCGTNRFTNVKLDVFRQYQNTKTILKKKNMGQNRFKKLSKYQKFQFSNFALTWSNKRKMNSVGLDMTYSKELQQRMEMLDKRILKKIWITQF